MIDAKEESFSWFHYKRYPVNSVMRVIYLSRWFFDNKIESRPSENITRVDEDTSHTDKKTVPQIQINGLLKNLTSENKRLNDA